jgi:hypothetical protein
MIVYEEYTHSFYKSTEPVHSRFLRSRPRSSLTAVLVKRKKGVLRNICASPHLRQYHGFNILNHCWNCLNIIGPLQTIFWVFLSKQMRKLGQSPQYYLF